MRNKWKWVGTASAVLLVLGTVAWMLCRPSPIAVYKIDPNVKETPKNFTTFLESCTLEERIALKQSLRGLKQEIGPDCYGKLVGLAGRDKYAQDAKKVTENLTLLPKTYNEVSPVTVADAMAKGHLSEDLVSPMNIKKEMIWRRYNKLTYLAHRYGLLRREGSLDYHRDYVMWSAAKCGVDEKMRDDLSTFYLEQEVYKKKFADIWDKLKPEQREELLTRIEKSGGSVGNKVAIASMAGAGAIAALSATAAFTGFAFYTSITSAMAVAAGWIGVSLPFTAYMTTMSTLGVITGPIGWCVAGGAAVAGGVALGWPDKDLVIAFVMTANAIKAKKMK